MNWLNIYFKENGTVAEIKYEIVKKIGMLFKRVIVHGNRGLIRLYEEKVKKVIEQVWED